MKSFLLFNKRKITIINSPFQDEDPAAEFLSREQEQLGDLDEELGAALSGKQEELGDLDEELGAALSGKQEQLGDL